MVWEDLYPDIDLYSQFKFHPKRKFRADFAHPQSRVAIDVSGGLWGHYGHSTGGGIQRDYTKQLLAASAGWILLPLSGADIENAEVLKLVKQVIDIRLGESNSASSIEQV